MKTNEEKKWERLQRLLSAEASGNTPVRICSNRTLFGIKSHQEEVMERVAKEHTQRCMEALNERKPRTDGPDAEGTH